MSERASKLGPFVSSPTNSQKVFASWTGNLKPLSSCDVFSTHKSSKRKLQAAEELYYPPFEGAIAAGVASVMCTPAACVCDKGRGVEARDFFDPDMGWPMAQPWRLLTGARPNRLEQSQHPRQLQQGQRSVELREPHHAGRAPAVGLPRTGV